MKKRSMLKLLVLLVCLMLVFSFALGCETKIDKITLDSTGTIQYSDGAISLPNLVVTYNDGTTQNVLITKSMISDRDLEKLNTFGTHQIKVTYQNIETEFEITIVGEKGDKGDTGEAGLGINSLDIVEGKLVITYTDGATTNLGQIIGSKGADGISITDITINTNDELIITFSSGDPINLGKIVGEDGVKGDKGDTGATGSKGDKGDTGATGSKGDKGDTGATGSKGDKGDSGATGNDGREIKIRNTETKIEWQYAGETEWKQLLSFADFKGAKGDTGEKGVDGLSSYEIYLKYNLDYTGTEEEWINDFISGKLFAIATLKQFIDELTLETSYDFANLELYKNTKATLLSSTDWINNLVNVIFDKATFENCFPISIAGVDIAGVDLDLEQAAIENAFFTLMGVDENTTLDDLNGKEITVAVEYATFYAHESLAIKAAEYVVTFNTENLPVIITVKFESNGGTLIDSFTGVGGTEFIKPADPTRDGFNFIGWFTDDVTFQNEYQFTTMPAEDLTVYANWELIENTITFESNGGTLVPDIIQAPGTELIQPADPTKDNNTFSGWFTDDATFQNEYQFTTMPAEDLTLYANWKSDPTITFVTGEGGSSVPLIIQPAGTEVTQPADPTKDGYTFMGWCTDEGTLANKYEFTTMPAEDVVLFADWAHTFTFTDVTFGLSVKKGTDIARITNLVIPTSVKGVPVVEIGGSAFLNCTSLVSIIIPDSVTAIKGTAFSGCTSLESLNIGKEVSSMFLNCFNYCNNLTKIIVHPDNLTFSSIDGVLLTDNGESIFKVPAGRTLPYTTPSNVETIKTSSFSGCAKLTSVTLSEGVVTLEDSAFSNCSLTNITIPSTVRTIGNSVFDSCTKLTTVTFLEGVLTLGESVFNNCSSLTSLTLPSTVTEMGKSIFKDCSNITSITIPHKVTWIITQMFSGCSKLTEIKVAIGNSAYSSVDGVVLTNNGETLFKVPEGRTLPYTTPSTVKTIGNSAFANCVNLASITILEGVTTIGTGVFTNCLSITSINIPKSVINIGKVGSLLGGNVFKGCTSLRAINVHADNTAYSSSLDGVLFTKDGTNLITFPAGITETYTMPNTVTRINDNAFEGCTLTGITLSNKLVEICTNAFKNCLALTRIDIPSTVTVVKPSAFSGWKAEQHIYKTWTTKPSGWNNNWSGGNATVH